MGNEMAWPPQSVVPSDSRLRYFSTWPAATLSSPSSQRALRPCLVAFVFFLPGCHVWMFLPGPATWHRLGNSNSLFVPSKRIVTSLRNQTLEAMPPSFQEDLWLGKKEGENMHPKPQEDPAQTLGSLGGKSRTPP